MEAVRRFIREKCLGVQAKLVFPLAVTILLLVLVLSPLTNRLINSRIEQEADRRLAEIADSVGALIANSEVLARNNAALLAEQPDVVNAFLDLQASSAALNERKTSLSLQELSLYEADFKAGDQAYYYGGPTVARQLQVSEDAERIRETLIANAIKKRYPTAVLPLLHKDLRSSALHLCSHQAGVSCWVWWWPHSIWIKPI